MTVPVLQSHQKYMRVSISPHICQYYYCLLYYSHHTGYEVVSNFTYCLNFPMANDVEHLLMFLLAIWIYSLEKWLVQSFARFKIGQFISLLLNCKCSLHILNTIFLSDTWFSSILCAFYSYSCWSFLKYKVFNFAEVLFVFFLLLNVLLV